MPRTGPDIHDAPPMSNTPSADDDRPLIPTQDAVRGAESGASPASSPTATTAAALALPALHEALTMLSRGGSVEDTLDLLTVKARLLTGCASAAIALLEPDKESVSFVAAAGSEARDLKGSRVLLADTVAGQTARTGESFLAYRPGEEDVAVESAAVVAIYEDGKSIGAFAALNKRNHLPFDGDDFMALSTLAAAASVTLGNARLRAREQRQGRELAILYEAMRRVSGQTSVQEVLRVVVAQAAEHLENNGIAIFVTNDERTHLYVAEDDGLSSDDHDVALSATQGIGAQLLTATHPLLLDFRADAPEGEKPTRGGILRCEPILPGFPGAGGGPARSGLSAPIRSGEEVRGFVLVVSQQPFGVYTTADANLLMALASQAAVAMENAELYEEATRRAEEAAALYELSQAVTSTLNLTDVLGRVADSTLALLDVDKFALFLHDRETRRLRLVVSRGLPDGAAERLAFGEGQGIPGWVMEFETPTAVQDVAADHRNATAPLHGEGVVSVTCMPLQVGPSTIGVLAAMSSRRRLFTVAEMELLYTIANQAAIAIENARVYADMRHQSVELRKYFHRVARALGTSQSPQEVPELIATLTCEIMGADRCVLHSVEPGTEDEWRQRTAASVGFRVVNYEPLKPLSSDTPTGWVAYRGRPLAVEDLEEDPRFAGRYDRPTRGVVRSYLGVPLRSGRSVMGVLEVYTRERRVWHHDATRLLMTFASQAAVAFENARLAAEREQAEATRRLAERLLTMTAQDPAPGADEVVAALALGLNAPVVTLYRAEGDPGWVPGPASIPRDTVPLVALQALLTEENSGNSALLDAQIAVSPDRSVAVAVLAPLETPEAIGSPATSPLLETAVTLLTRSRALKV